VKRVIALRPSPALVIACIALFISLGGVSWGLATGIIDSREIRNNTIRTQDLRNNDIRAIDIRNSTIRSRDIALNTLTGSDIAESKLGKVPSAEKADDADDATSLGGTPASSYLRRDSSPFFPLPLETDWEPVSPGNTPGYYVDPLGFVHLHGAMRRVTGSTELALTLPVRARPNSVKRLPVYGANGGGGVLPSGITINPDGTLVVNAPADALDNVISLEGVTFRARD
jgi:hypothetical protein